MAATSEYVKYYPSDDIIAFPSSNSVDEGKLTLEENMRAIITRITDRNYVLTDNSFVLTLVGTNKLQISTGSANIRGYHVTTNRVLTIDAPPRAGTNIPVGMKLTYDNSDHIRGDVEDGLNVVFEGIWVGYFNDTTDPDLLVLGTIDYDGTRIKNIRRNPHIKDRLDAKYINVIMQGPKPPARILTLQEFIDTMKEWYVSRYGDFIYGDGGPDNGTLGFKKKYRDTYYSASIDVGTTTSDGGKIESLGKNSAGNTTVYMKANRAGFSGTTFKIADTGTTAESSIGYTMGNQHVFKILHNVTKGATGRSEIEFNSKYMFIKSTGGSISTCAYNTNSVDNLTTKVNPKTFEIGSTANLNGHIFGYDSGTGKNPYYSLGHTTMSCVGTVTSIVSTGNPDIRIKPNLITEIMKATNAAHIGTNFNVKINDAGYIQTTGTTTKTEINKINSTGFVTNKNFIATNNIANPTNGSSIYSAINANTFRFNNTTGTSTIYFTGNSGTNSVNIYHAYNEDILRVTGNLTVSKDIRANRVYNAVYNDIVEFMEKEDPNEIIVSGDVICINDEGKCKKVRCEEDIGMIVGICSSDKTYGYALGGSGLKDNEKVPIGLVGRIYANTDNKTIKAGDILVALPNGKVDRISSNHKYVVGKAMRHPKDGQVYMLIKY